MLGMGAVAVPVPPLEVLYHNKFVPVAVRAVAVAPRQYVTCVITVGAAGAAITCTFIVALGLSPQPPVVVWLT